MGVRLGAQGAISGLANVIAPRLLGLVQHGQEDPAVVQFVNDVVKYPVIPAVKALVAAKTGDDNWRRMRSPLVDLPPADARGAGRDLFVGLCGKGGLTVGAFVENALEVRSPPICARRPMTVLRAICSPGKSGPGSLSRSVNSWKSPACRSARSGN